MVRQNFLAPNADTIQNIPLSTLGGQDFLAWSLNMKGINSVKPAYRALMTQNELPALEEGTVMETSSADTHM